MKVTTENLTASMKVFVRKFEDRKDPVSGLSKTEVIILARITKTEEDEDGDYRISIRDRNLVDHSDTYHKDEEWCVIEDDSAITLIR